MILNFSTVCCININFFLWEVHILEDEAASRAYIEQMWAEAMIYDRSQRHEQRDPKEIGISAVRGGTIVGDHDVIFAGPDEVVTLSHRAYSKGVFGKGAVEAAKFLAGKPAGMYDMQDVIAAK